MFLTRRYVSQKRIQHACVWYSSLEDNLYTISRRLVVQYLLSIHEFTNNQ